MLRFVLPLSVTSDLELKCEFSQMGDLLMQI